LQEAGCRGQSCRGSSVEVDARPAGDQDIFLRMQ
jgi:hypothetical protein